MSDLSTWPEDIQRLLILLDAYLYRATGTARAAAVRLGQVEVAYVTVRHREHPGPLEACKQEPCANLRDWAEEVRPLGA